MSNRSQETTMPRLIKFCRPEHNLIQRCHTIQLGSLAYFRKMDPNFCGDQIPDATEGIEWTNIRSVDTAAASQEALESLAPLVRMPHVHIQNIALKTTFPNCFVWCCCQFPDSIPLSKAMTLGARFDPEYTSCYAVADPVRFAECLCSLLMTNSRRETFDPKAQQIFDHLSVSEMGQISIGWYHRPVLYVDEKWSLVSKGKLHPYVKDIPRPLRPLFVKPRSYEWQREYRFVLWFEHQRYGILPVRNESVVLPIMPIAGLT